LEGLAEHRVRCGGFDDYALEINVERVLSIQRVADLIAYPL
jgi:hypothetical protein